MESSGNPPSGGVGAENGAGNEGVSTSPALTSVDDLRESIAERYALAQYSAYPSRIASFGVSQKIMGMPKPRKQKPTFVTAAYLRDTVGVSVYQPTGYAVQRDYAGTSKLNDEQFSQVPSMQPIAPAITTFSKQGPMLDRKATDTRKPEEVGRLKDEDDLRRKAIHVVQGIKDKYDYDYSED